MSKSAFTSLTYERSIATVRKGLGLEGSAQQSLDFLDDSAAVIAWIDGSKYATNSRKTFYIAIVSTLKNNDLFPFAEADYRAKMDALNEQVATKALDQELTELEKAKYLIWPEVLEAYEKIRLAVHDLDSFQNYLIVSLYVLQPPVRLDYAEMRIVTEEPAEHGANYLVWPKESGGTLGPAPYFLLTDYKTYKHKGALRNPLSPKLCDVIREWMAMVDDDYLLIGSNGLPMQPWELGQRLIRTFESCTGKSVGANILRHSFDSWKHRNEMSFKESAALALSMGHSQQMAQLYRRI